MIDVVQLSKPALRQRRGFTLVELLVVLAIISILTTLSIMGTSSLLASSHLDEAAAIVQGQLDLARQTAKTLNRSVQLRLYEEKSAAATSAIDRLQIVVPAEKSTAGTDQAIGKPVALPQSVIMVDGNDPLLTQLSGNASLFNPALPANYTGCYVLTFSPTGAITAMDGNGDPVSPGSGTAYWLFSVVPETQYVAGGGMSGLHNYATFYLNSINGTYSSKRP
jgi:uncharacterized protein (TIGR02596 family)